MISSMVFVVVAPAVEGRIRPVAARDAALVELSDLPDERDCTDKPDA